MNVADRQNSNTVLLTLLTLVALSLLCNVDHGVLPAASIAIKADLSLNNLQYGMVGSSVFAGLTTGSVVSTFAYSKFNTKLILVTVIFGMATSLIMFT